MELFAVLGSFEARVIFVRSAFIESLTARQPAFGLSLDDKTIGRLADYYELVQEHNPLLHLVGPSTPEDFAVRHILESLVLLEHLPAKVKFADVGTGAGLPSIPCLLARHDLRALLIEAKEKKAKFLSSALDTLGLAARAAVENRQFHEIDPGDCEFVACRALDKFTAKLSRLAKWAMRRPMLLFGGENLKQTLQDQNIPFVQSLIPLSERRCLFVTQRRL